MQYKVSAYLCTNFAGLMDNLETDNFYEVQDFVHEQCMRGFNCEVRNMETGDRGLIYAESYCEEFNGEGISENYINA